MKGYVTMNSLKSNCLTALIVIVWGITQAHLSFATGWKDGLKGTLQRCFSLSILGKSSAAPQTKIRENTPDESGLTETIKQFALVRNHPVQVPKFIEELGHTIDGLEHAVLGPDLMISEEHYQLLQMLRRTNLKKGRNSLLSSVNGAVEEAKKGEKIDNAFIDGLQRLKDRLRAVADRLDALEASNVAVPYYSSRYLVYNPEGKAAAEIIEGAKAALPQLTTAAILGREPYPKLDPANVSALERYLQAYVDGNVQIVHFLPQALSALERNDEHHGSHYVDKWAEPMLRRAVSEIQQRYPDDATRSGWQRAERLVEVTRDILSRALLEGRALPEVSRVFVESCRNGQTAALHAGLSKNFFLNDDKPQAYQILQTMLNRINDNATLSDRNELAEGIYFGFINHCLESATWADANLSRGMGFHNAVRVRSYMEDAALATEAYAKSRLVTARSKRINFELLARAFRALEYDNGGRRQAGDAIGPLEAFGIGGAERQDKTDPYRAIALYILKQTSARGITNSSAALPGTDQTP